MPVSSSTMTFLRNSIVNIEYCTCPSQWKFLQSNSLNYQQQSLTHTKRSQLSALTYHRYWLAGTKMYSKLLSKKLQTKEGMAWQKKIPMQNRDENPSFVQALELGVWTAPNIPTPVISHNGIKVIWPPCSLVFPDSFCFTYVHMSPQTWAKE